MIFNAQNTSSGSASTTWYGTCGTTASTAAKAVTCAGFELSTGAIVGVLFTTANTAATPTLNVNSTGAKSIYVGSSTPNSTTNVLKWSANTLLYFMYDGTYYRYMGETAAASVNPPDGAGVWYGTSSTSEGTAAKTTAIDNFKLVKGAVVNVNFSTANTVEGSITLNVNSTGAKTVYFEGGSTSGHPLLWQANEILTFVYSGSYWYCVGRDLRLVDGNLELNNMTISIEDAYNDDHYGGSGSLILNDVYGNQMGCVQTIQQHAGTGMESTIAIQLVGNNHTNDDYNTLALGFDENEVAKTQISHPAAFREALSLGEQPTPPSTPSSASIAKSTNTNIMSISPGAGKWLISGRVRFGATTSGIRTIKLSTTSADTSTPHAVQSVPYGSQLYISVLGFFDLSASESVYLIAYHDNNSAVDVAMGQLRAMRIG